nr:hypothetical protein Iba_chr14aCG20320 [Ipomoea batatas]
MCGKEVNFVVKHSNLIDGDERVSYFFLCKQGALVHGAQPKLEEEILWSEMLRWTITSISSSETAPPNLSRPRFTLFLLIIPINISIRLALSMLFPPSLRSN